MPFVKRSRRHDLLFCKNFEIVDTTLILDLFTRYIFLGMRGEKLIYDSKSGNFTVRLVILAPGPPTLTFAEVNIFPKCRNCLF